MAEKFGIGPGPHELKLGSSFTSSEKLGKNGGKFHTIRYDFKPASVDTTKKGKVEIGESNSLSVTVPHSNGSAETHYNGHLKDSSQKECVLIIDRNTGEITLEKLSGHMLLKKTRQERPEKSAQIDRLVNNSANFSSNSAPTSYNSASSSSFNPASSSMSSSAARPPSRPRAPVTSMKRDSPAGTPKQQPPSRSASPHIPTTTLAQAAASISKPAKVDLSESSSSSSSSGSDSDSDFDEVPAPPFQNQAKPVVNPSMPSFLDTSSPPRQPKMTQNQPPAQPSMPQFLNDDLQLSSESDDSD